MAALRAKSAIYARSKRAAMALRQRMRQFRGAKRLRAQKAMVPLPWRVRKDALTRYARSMHDMRDNAFAIHAAPRALRQRYCRGAAAARSVISAAMRAMRCASGASPRKRYAYGLRDAQQQAPTRTCGVMLLMLCAARAMSAASPPAYVDMRRAVYAAARVQYAKSARSLLYARAEASPSAMPSRAFFFAAASRRAARLREKARAICLPRS